MLKHNKHRTLKHKWFEDSVFTPDDFVNNNTYVSISFRKRKYTPKTHKIMNKRIEKYFEKVEQDSLNQTKIMSPQYNNLRSIYDSYMNLSVNERRKIPTTSMRGYQIDRSGRLLYSFEDQCVYNVSIGSNFNKIVVISIHHKFTDVEKRNVFDNPNNFEPVSPYRIQWPSSDIKGESQLSLINIEKSLASVGDVFKNIENASNTFAETMNKTMENFTSSVNNIAEQNVNIQNNISDLLGEGRIDQKDEDSLLSDLYLKQYGRNTVYYQDDGKKPIGLDNKRHCMRGSKLYREKVDLFGWIDDGTFIYHPDLVEKTPITINNTVTQENIANTQVFNTLQAVINNLNAAVSKMSAFDISANMSNLYTTISSIAKDVHAIKEHGLGDVNVQVTEADDLNEILEKINTKMNASDYDKTIKELSDSYQKLVDSILNQQENLSKSITNLINNQNALFARTEQQFKDCVAAAVPNKETIIPHIDVTASLSDTTQQEINSLKDLYNILNSQYTDFINQVKEYNTQLASITPIATTVQNLGGINTMIDNSRRFYQGLFDKLLASDDTTRNLLTDNQTQNAEMLSNIQESINNKLEYDTESKNISTKDEYSQWLSIYNINVDNIEEFYNKYVFLSNTPVTTDKLEEDEKSIQESLMEEKPYVIDVVNKITHFLNKDLSGEDLSDLRDEYTFFINIISNFNDQSFFKSIGYSKLLNAYLNRDNNEEISNIFDKLANRELTEEDKTHITQVLQNDSDNVNDPQVERFIGITLRDLSA